MHNGAYSSHINSPVMSRSVMDRRTGGSRNGRQNQGGGHTHNYPWTGGVNTVGYSEATIMVNAPPGVTLEIPQHVHSGNFPSNSGTHRHGLGNPRPRRTMGGQGGTGGRRR